MDCTLGGLTQTRVFGDLPHVALLLSKTPTSLRCFSEMKPAIYHCIARMVDRRFAFGSDDKEPFRIYMRMMERISPASQRLPTSEALTSRSLIREREELRMEQPIGMIPKSEVAGVALKNSTTDDSDFSD